MIQKVAYTEKLEIIDLHPLLVDKAKMVPDKVHPDALGSGIIAAWIYEALTKKSEQTLSVIFK